ncbi:MAG: endonuclease Q family protein, partial [Oscillospiraceae bacterium]|nr:endonuclease Q family protein [Oscillospiraceae bacterium]
MVYADLHVHSRYSRATSKDCVPSCLEGWARVKGLGLLGTGDFTHAGWRAELERCLEPCGDGLYALSERARRDAGPTFPPAPDGLAQPRFVVSGEVSCIYRRGGRTRKVHSLMVLPSL